MSGCIGKDSWPELVGRTGEDAAEIIERENPLVNAIVLLDPSATTRDFRCDRVWVWVNSRKDSWPELVGLKGEDAAKKIEQQNSHVKAIVLLDGTPTTRDFRCNRVWVWVDSHGIVLRPPKIG
ncbi:hypothetical protein OSB04_023280 [Centaurea solstitialis]|uniref:Proteinase inhibitor n=1 Tax=Centaurea solstitialis TaxID=347529 RepID=A0AA38SRD4_9ASTR|nr:hypothetical protein OSB04_023280 [Centaurea solstitialis]